MSTGNNKAPIPYITHSMADMANGLRKLADDIEGGRISRPWSIPLYLYWIEELERDDTNITVEDVRRTMALTPGNWSKWQTENTIEYRKQYSDNVSVTLNLNREQVCKRVQVGIKHVEAKFVEAHDEPVYGWDCDESPALPDDNTMYVSDEPKRSLLDSPAYGYETPNGSKS